jgi:hypothetical protein
VLHFRGFGSFGAARQHKAIVDAAHVEAHKLNIVEARQQRQRRQGVGGN